MPDIDKTVYRLYALPLTANNIRAAAQERFSRATPTPAPGYVLVYTDGEILKNVLHDISALEYAGEGTVLLIEFRDEAVAGDADAGHGVAVAGTHFLNSGGDGLQGEHKNTPFKFSKISF